MQLRDYQLDSVEKTFAAWDTASSVLGVSPTGSGKTSIACEIIRRNGGRTLVLAHKNELVKQFRQRLWQFGLDSEIEKADMWADSHTLNGTPVVIATPQTLYSRDGKRLQRWPANTFSLLIADEAHHYAGAQAFERVVKHFQANPDLKTLGLSATPDRHDGIALARVFETVAFNIEITDMIDQGYLVDVDQRLVRIQSLDLSHCRTTAGDLNGADLAQVVEQEKNLLGMVDASLRVIEDRKALVFASSVKHAERMAEIFNRYRPGSADSVFGHTPEHKRHEIFKRFAGSELQILTNVDVCNEAYDNPAIQVIVMARPTKSRPRYAQMLGRGLRPLTGVIDDSKTSEERQEAIKSSAKPAAVILDFAGNSGKHKLILSADVLGGRFCEEARALAIKRANAKGRSSMLSDLREAERELREEQDRLKRAGVKGNARFSMTYVDPFAMFQRRAEKWRGHVQRYPLTSKQRQLLLTHGYNPDEYSPADGQAIISKLFSMSSKQREVLLRAGYTVEELEGIQKWEATEMIGVLAKNSWRRPDSPGFGVGVNQFGD
ncbi:MAG: DEAD/DEAH box helicase [Acidobacteriota bacterium]|nr:DEAD/DEAH box helicase [Acidobacteriota bacterium]